MTLVASVVDVSPASNPDTIIAAVTFSGDYGTQGVGDLLNLAPYDVNANPTGMTNPKNLPLPSIPAGLESAPEVIAENIGGYYVQPDPLVPAAGATEGVAKTLAAKNGIGLRMYAVGGTGELATNAAYAGVVTGGNVLIKIQLPHDQG